VGQHSPDDWLGAEQEDSSPGQTDPGGDGLGIYFDLDGTEHCNTPPLGPVELYMLLTNASAPGGVGSWTCRVEFDEVPSCFFQGFTANGYTGSIWTPPDLYIILIDPLPWAPAIKLLTLSFLINNPQCMWFYILPHPNSPIPGQILYIDGADPQQFIPMHRSTGGPGTPVAGLNCDCPPPVNTEISSWGEVKSLYR